MQRIQLKKKLFNFYNFHIHVGEQRQQPKVNQILSTIIILIVFFLILNFQCCTQIHKFAFNLKYKIKLRIEN